MITIELPYPPSVNRYWRYFRNRVVVSAEGRAFKEKVLLILRAMGSRTLEGPLILRVDLYPPDRRRRDVDNPQKAILDALQYSGLYRNDSQIVRLVATRREPVPNGKTIVRIQEFKR